MTPAVPLAVMVASLLLVAGCGTIDSGGDMTAEPTTGSDASPGATELTIVVRPGRGKQEHTYTLRCDPPGGDHPDPEAACRSLEEIEEPFAPVPNGTMCAQVYGGPQTATVTGRFRGEPMEAAFSRTDGCEVSRWDEHATLLVQSGGVEDS
jgi:hypothetical protein